MEKSSAFVATFFACFMLVCMGGNGAKEILEEIPHLSKLRQIRSDLERIRTDIERIVQDKKGAQLEAASGLFKDINHLIRRLHELTGRPATGKEGFEFPDPDLPDAEEKKQKEYQDLIARPEPKDERKELQVRLAKVEADQTSSNGCIPSRKRKTSRLITWNGSVCSCASNRRSTGPKKRASSGWLRQGYPSRGSSRDARNKKIRGTRGK